MSLLTLSISHRTAPMAVVETVSLSLPQQDALAAALIAQPQVYEVLVLSTCNRTELHVVCDRFHAGFDAAVAALADQTGLEREALAEICDVGWDANAINHVFSLTAGLESLVVGENQILGQVRAALQRAQRRRTAGRTLNTLVQNALRVGKRVHTETAIGGAGRSVLSAALDEVESHGITLDQRRVLIVGAGQMAGLAARTLAHRGGDVVVVNRTRARADRLAEQVGGRAAGTEQLSELLGWADLVVTCTGAAHSLIDPATLAALDHKPLAICDLALPADVHPRVAEHTLLVNLTSLSERLADDHSHDVEVAAATALVAEEVAEHLRLERSQAVTPTVVALRAMADQVVEAERVRLARRVDVDEATMDEIAKALGRVADKIIHAPTVELRTLAGGEDDTDYADLMRRLFRLDTAEIQQAGQEQCDTRAALTVGAVEALRRPQRREATQEVPR